MIRRAILWAMCLSAGTGCLVEGERAPSPAPAGDDPMGGNDVPNTESTVPASPTPYPGPCLGEAHYEFTGTDVPDFRMRTTYNSAGDVTLTEYDATADGVYENKRRFSYDASGVLQMEEALSNDELWEVRTLFYDPEGRLIREETVDPPEEEPHYAQTYSYSGSTTVILERDNGADSIVEQREISVLDGDGRLIRKELDSEADDVIDAVHEFEYNLAGLETTFRRINVVTDNVLIVESEYDLQGRLARVQTDTTSDGTIDSLVVYEYLADRTIQSYDHPVGGPIDATETRILDEAGNILRMEMDTDADGSTEIVWTYDYGCFE